MTSQNCECIYACQQSPLYEPLVDFSTDRHCSSATVLSNVYNKLFIPIDKLNSLSANVYLENDIFVVIDEANHYEINLEVKLKTKSGSCHNNSAIQLSIYDVTNNAILATSNFNDHVAVLAYTQIFAVQTKIGFIITGLSSHAKIKCLKMVGSIKNSPRLTLLDEVLAYDAARKFRYIPLNPNLPNPPYGPQFPATVPPNAVQFGWGYNIIPNEVNQPPFVYPANNPYILTPFSPFPTTPALPATIDYDGYHKLNSVSAYLPYCIGFPDPINLDPNDPRVTVFASDLENRGVNNYRKKVYMSALTADLMPNYAEKIDVFLNEIYTIVTNYPKPALSVFQEALVRFFLAMHVGYDDYPDYVIEYFTKFTKAVGLGDVNAPTFKSDVLFCNITIDCVSRYFFERYNSIRQSADNTTLLYYWNLAGLPKEAIISEALHNIIAFNQFLNVFFLMIKDQYGPGTTVPIGTPAAPGSTGTNYGFVQKFCTALTNEDKLDVVREFYRLTVPNSASFSRLEVGPTGSVPPGGSTNPITQARHVHQAIMFSSEAATSTSVSNYSTYQPEIYDNFTFDMDSAMNSTCPPPECPRCPYLVPVNPLKNINPEVKLTQSTIDNQTVIERACDLTVDPGKAIPVYANKPFGPGPIYTPFGLGYRRCAGEMFSYFVTMKLFERFKSIPFEFVGTPPATIAVAPFTLVPNNIFFDPDAVPVCL